MSRDEWRQVGQFTIGVFAGMALVGVMIDPMAGALFVILYYVAYQQNSRLAAKRRGRQTERGGNGERHRSRSA